MRALAFTAPFRASCAASLSNLDALALGVPAWTAAARGSPLGSRGQGRCFSDTAGADPGKLAAPFPILGFVRFVPEKHACVVERFGRFNRVLTPGFNVTVPLVESIAYTHTMKELTLPVHTQQAITRDNVTIHIDSVLYVKIVDAFKASYGVDRPLYAIMQLAQTSMRSELGKMTLDNTFAERDTLNEKIVQVINGAAVTWGLECLRYEIKDIVPPSGIMRAMELQAEAERRKRAQVLESEGSRQATINESEAKREAAINRAIGEAEAIQRKAKATAEGVKMVATAMAAEYGRDAVSMHLAQQYVTAFGQIAKEGNTMIVPADPTNVYGMIAQAASVFKAGQTGSVQRKSDSAGSKPCQPSDEQDGKSNSARTDSHAADQDMQPPRTLNESQLNADAFRILDNNAAKGLFSLRSTDNQS